MDPNEHELYAEEEDPYAPKSSSGLGWSDVNSSISIYCPKRIRKFRKFQPFMTKDFEGELAALPVIAFLGEK